MFVCRSPYKTKLLSFKILIQNLICDIHKESAMKYKRGSQERQKASGAMENNTMYNKLFYMRIKTKETQHIFSSVIQTERFKFKMLVEFFQILPKNINGLVGEKK